MSQESSASNNLAIRQTACNEICYSHRRHPVRDNQPIQGTSYDVQSFLSDITDSLDGAPASADKDTVLNKVRAYHVYALNAISAEGINLRNPGLEVIKLEFILKLKIKCNNWLLADTCP